MSIDQIWKMWENAEEWGDRVNAGLQFLNWVAAERRVWDFKGNIRNDVPIEVVILAYEMGLRFYYNRNYTKVWL